MRRFLAAFQERTARDILQRCRCLSNRGIDVRERKSARITSRTQEKASEQRIPSPALNGKPNKPSRGVTKLSEFSATTPARLPADVISNLRKLAHGLSNSLETILQAAYLLSQSKLDDNGKKWSQLIDTAAQDATRVNREIREILRSQS
jgi:nitrogen-specific signal transduction histidine kinase